MKITCFSVLKALIDTAVSKSGFKVDEEKESNIIKVCEIIDGMSKEFGGIGYNVEILDGSGDIIIELECDEITLEDKDSDVYKIFDHAKSVGFTHGKEEESLIMIMTFPGVWSDEQ